jgi:hypothetical protein
MHSNIKRPLVALGAVAALALPASAVAHGGHGHAAGKHGQAGDTHGQGGKHGRALNVKGTVTAVGAGTIDVLVKGANHHGRALRGTTITVDVSTARIVVADANGDGTRDLADIAVGDRVLVRSRIAKGATPDPAQPLVAAGLVDKGPAHTDGTVSPGDTGDGGGTPPTP